MPPPQPLAPSPIPHPLSLVPFFDETGCLLSRLLLPDQTNIEAVYHQLAMLRSKMAATAAANTQVPASAAAEGAQTENALLTLVEANLRVVEGQRCVFGCLSYGIGCCYFYRSCLFLCGA